MSPLSELERLERPSSTSKGSTVAVVESHGASALARLIERTQQLESSWFGIARNAHNLAEKLERQTRRIEAMVCLAGAIGLVEIIASQFQNLVPRNYSVPLSVAGIALSSAPLALSLWSPMKRKRAQKAKFLEFGAQARVKGRITKDIAQAAKLVQPCEASAVDALRPLEELIEGIEADAAKSNADIGRGVGIKARKHRRIVPRQRRVIIQTADRRSLTGEIANISLSGMALSSPLPRVSVGEEVLINRRAATIVRVWNEGVAFEFKTQLDPSMLNENIVL